MALILLMPSYVIVEWKTLNVPCVPEKKVHCVESDSRLALFLMRLWMCSLCLDSELEVCIRDCAA